MALHDIDHPENVALRQSSQQSDMAHRTIGQNITTLSGDLLQNGVTGVEVEFDQAVGSTSPMLSVSVSRMIGDVPTADEDLSAIQGAMTSVLENVATDGQFVPTVQQVELDRGVEMVTHQILGHAFQASSLGDQHRYGTVDYDTTTQVVEVDLNARNGDTGVVENHTHTYKGTASE